MLRGVPDEGVCSADVGIVAAGASLPERLRVSFGSFFFFDASEAADAEDKDANDIGDGVDFVAGAGAGAGSCAIVIPETVVVVRGEVDDDIPNVTEGLWDIAAGDEPETSTPCCFLLY